MTEGWFYNSINMEYTISFYPNGNKADVAMFVRKAKINYLGRLKMEFTADIKEAGMFSPSTGIVDKICDKLKKIYGQDTTIVCMSDKASVTARQPFYVIAVENNPERQYVTGVMAKGMDLTRDVRKAYISQSRLDIDGVLTMARNKGVGKARVIEVYMNIENTLQGSNFVLIASRKNSDKVSYVCSTDTSKLSVSDNFCEACFLGYDDVIKAYEALKAGFSDMRFAVIQKPMEEVDSNKLADYIKEHGNNNKITISIKLRD